MTFKVEAMDEKTGADGGSIYCFLEAPEQLKSIHIYSHMHIDAV